MSGPPSERKLIAIRNYIAADTVAAAQRVEFEILRRVAALGLNPRMGKSARLGVDRVFVLAGLPYLVVYRVKDDQVIIKSILHGRQVCTPM